MGFRDEKTASQFIDTVKQFHKMSLDKVDFKDLTLAYNKLKTEVSGLFEGNKLTADRKLNIGLLKLKQSLQADYDNAVGTILGGEAQKAYVKANSKYSALKGISDELAQVLETDNISASSLSNWLFKNEKQLPSIERVSQVRSLLDLSGKPDAWDNISANYVKDIINGATDMKQGFPKTNWNKVVKQIGSLPQEVQNAIMPKRIEVPGYKKAGAEALKDLGRLFSAKEFGTPELLAKDPSHKREVYDATMAAVTQIGKVRAAADAFLFYDKENKLAKFLSSEGVEEVLKTTPPSKRKVIRESIEFYLERARKLDKLRMGDKLMQQQMSEGINATAAGD
jgi:hypothetical protein